MDRNTECERARIHSHVGAAPLASAERLGWVLCAGIMLALGLRGGWLMLADEVTG